MVNIKSSYDKLCAYMSKSKTIEDWNHRRNVAKDKYPSSLICQLDGSGLVNKIVPKRK